MFLRRTRAEEGCGVSFISYKFYLSKLLGIEIAVSEAFLYNEDQEKRKR